MQPIAFEIFGMEVRWYGILIAFAMLIGIFLVDRETKKAKISTNDVFNLIMIILPSAIIGARLYYVIFDWSSYKDNLIEILNIRGGGLAFHGGLITGSIAAIIYMKKKSIRITRNLMESSS